MAIKMACMCIINTKHYISETLHSEL